MSAMLQRRVVANLRNGGSVYLTVCVDYYISYNLYHFSKHAFQYLQTEEIDVITTVECPTRCGR